MPLKDRFRRAIGRPSRSSSNSSASSTHAASAPVTTNTSNTPTQSRTPSITLTKTSTRLSKTLTWTNRKTREEDKAKKRLEDWERKDEQEWKEPKTKYPGRKSKPHQDMLRAFEWKFRERSRASIDSGRSEGNRRWSVWSGVSGVSPSASRMNSVEVEGPGVKRMGSGAGTRKRSSGAGGLSREVSRTEEASGQGMVETVQEE